MQEVTLLALASEYRGSGRVLVASTLFFQTFHDRIKTIMYERAWRELHIIRVRFVSAVLCLVALAVAEHFINPQFYLTPQMVICFGAWSAFWCYAFLKFLWWKCPRCGLVFQSGPIWGPWTFWPRKRCHNCGLEVGR